VGDASCAGETSLHRMRLERRLREGKDAYSGVARLCLACGDAPLLCDRAESQGCI